MLAVHQPAIGPQNPCVACLDQGRTGAYESSQSKKLLDGRGCIHYYRKECREWAGLPPLERKSKKRPASSVAHALDDDPEPPRQRATGPRSVPPVLATIYEIKDSRMCPVDCESIVNEEEDEDLSCRRRNAAPEYAPVKQLLEFKVYGLFKLYKGEEGKLDTHWMSIEEMRDKYASRAQPPEIMAYIMMKIHDYEKKYLAVRQAHYERAYAEMGFDP